ncbi:hypothetical protein PTKIN_Ptkin15bG0127000 [Pterospermum kingtungense]
MDAAISDGVDVLSLSLGGFPLPLFDDNIAIGSFRAVEHGISVICAAGNNGQIQSSVANTAPWIATIGAGNRLPGAEKDLELVYITGGNTGSEFCFRGSLPRAKVRGKMVVCERGVMEEQKKI